MEEASMNGGDTAVDHPTLGASHTPVPIGQATHTISLLL